jgi:glutamate formiminotransferase
MTVDKEQKKRLEEIILSNIYEDDVDFIEVKQEDTKYDVQVNEFEVAGLLWKQILLSELRSVCGLGADEDELILTTLESLSRAGKLKIFEVKVTPQMRFDDIRFHVEIGIAKKTASPVNQKFSVLRFFYQEPLKKNERDKHTVLNVKEIVQKIAQLRDETFSQRYGRTNPEIEKGLVLTELMARSEYQKNLRKVANGIDEKKTLQ